MLNYYTVEQIALHSIAFTLRYQQLKSQSSVTPFILSLWFSARFDNCLNVCYYQISFS